MAAVVSAVGLGREIGGAGGAGGAGVRSVQRVGARARVCTVRPRHGGSVDPAGMPQRGVVEEDIAGVADNVRLAGDRGGRDRHGLDYVRARDEDGAAVLFVEARQAPDCLRGSLISSLRDRGSPAAAAGWRAVSVFVFHSPQQSGACVLGAIVCRSCLPPTPHPPACRARARQSAPVRPPASRHPGRRRSASRRCAARPRHLAVGGTVILLTLSLRPY